MHNELYPSPVVNWYPGAQLPAKNPLPSGLSYPRPDTAAPSATFSTFGYDAGGRGGGSSTSKLASSSGRDRGPELEGFMNSEYGRQAYDANAMSFYTNAAAMDLPPGYLASYGNGARNANGFGRDAPNSGKAIAATPPMAQLPATRESLNDLPVGQLAINVDSALDLTPSDRFGAHHYFAAAGYPGESEEQVLQRRTVAIKGNHSTTNSGCENCIFHKRVLMPYNSRQQFVMVSVFEADQIGETFIGKATIPLADPKLASTSPWQLYGKNSDPNGILTLNIQLPEDDDAGACGLGAAHETRSSLAGAASGHPALSSTNNPYGPPPPRGSSDIQTDAIRRAFDAARADPLGSSRGPTAGALSGRLYGDGNVSPVVPPSYNTLVGNTMGLGGARNRSITPTPVPGLVGVGNAGLRMPSSATTGASSGYGFASNTGFNNLFGSSAPAAFGSSSTTGAFGTPNFFGGASSNAFAFGASNNRSNGFATARTGGGAMYGGVSPVSQSRTTLPLQTSSAMYRAGSPAMHAASRGYSGMGIPLGGMRMQG